MVKKVNDEANSGQWEFYLPHKAVIRENTESTKLQTVYDAFARENSRSLWLNNCLETDPALQNLLWGNLIRTRFKPIALWDDLQKSFLRIRIKKEDCDALRFHWVRREDSNQTEVLRFTRLVFGLVQFPFILEGTTDEHRSSYTGKYPAEIADEIRDELYVDYLGKRIKIFQLWK